MKKSSSYRLILVSKCLLSFASLDLFGDVQKTETFPPHPSHSPSEDVAIRATDLDHGTILLNQPGTVTVVIGTSQDSWKAARLAYKAMYPFQGKTDFRFIPVVDLHKSLATLFPSIAEGQMRKNLDMEAADLKPQFLKNGNNADPRISCHLVPDFKGTLLSQLNWGGKSNQLHAIVYGADGREIRRWDSVGDTQELEAVVRSALQSLEGRRTKTEMAEVSTAHS